MKPWFRRLDRETGRLYDGIGTLVGVSIGLFAVSISLDLGLRLLGVGNLGGMQEIIEYVLFAGVFLTAPWLLRQGAHVRVDLLVQNLSPQAALTLERVMNAVGFLICATMVWYASVNLGGAYAFGSEQRKYFNVPEWWLLSVVVVSFALLTLEFLNRFLRADAGDDDADAPAAGL